MNVGKRTLLAVATASVAVAVAVSAAPGSQSRSLAGGTYRVGVESFYGSAFPWPWGGGFDPTGESDTAARAIYTNLLVRTLVGTNHVAGKRPGSDLVPDLAVSVPAPTNGGTTYTFRLKRGIRFGPPVNREITARRHQVRDRAARAAEERLAVYASAFDDIQGFGAYRSGKATSISGIVTPNAKTITFRLTRPAGDFLQPHGAPRRRPDPAARWRRCFEGNPGAYGRDVIASGPYMIEGSSEVRIGSCGANQADARDLGHAAHARPQPELRPQDRQQGGPGEQPGPVRVRRHRQRPSRSSTS